MEINITGRHVEVADTIKEHIIKRVNKELEDFPKIESVHVILSLEKYRHGAHYVIQAAGHVRIEAEETSNDMYISIDRALDNAVKQLMKHYDKKYMHIKEKSLSEKEIEAENKIL